MPDTPTTTDAAVAIDTTVAHPARRYNYWLGGKDNFAADRASGDRILAAHPIVRVAALENRTFLGRAVHHLARTGIRQYLDIGTGYRRGAARRGHGVGLGRIKQEILDRYPGDGRSMTPDRPGQPSLVPILWHPRQLPWPQHAAGFGEDHARSCSHGGGAA